MNAAATVILMSLIASSCSAQTSAKLSVVGRSSRVSTDPSVVEVVATVRNVGARTATIIRPICPLRVFAYSTPDRRREPLWISRGDTCISDLIARAPIEIGIADYYDFKARVALPDELLGNQLFLSIELPTLGSYPVGQLERIPQMKNSAPPRSAR
jgi:hypothetical protein